MAYDSDSSDSPPAGTRKGKGKGKTSRAEPKSYGSSTHGLNLPMPPAQNSFYSYGYPRMVADLPSIVIPDAEVGPVVRFSGVDPRDSAAEKQVWSILTQICKEEFGDGTPPQKGERQKGPFQWNHEAVKRVLLGVAKYFKDTKIIPGNPFHFVADPAQEDAVLAVKLLYQEVKRVRKLVDTHKEGGDAFRTHEAKECLTFGAHDQGKQGSTHHLKLDEAYCTLLRKNYKHITVVSDEATRAALASDYTKARSTEGSPSSQSSGSAWGGQGQIIQFNAANSTQPPGQSSREGPSQQSAFGMSTFYQTLPSVSDPMGFYAMQAQGSIGHGIPPAPYQGMQWDAQRGVWVWR